MKKVLGVTLLASSLSFTGFSHAGWVDFIEDAKKTGGELLKQQLEADQSIDNETLLNGLREALAVGSERAVELIGQPGGYLDDQQIRIPMPTGLSQAAPILEKFGLGSQVEQFETSINRAAEQAVPQAIPLLLETIRGMTFDDVRRIYEGADDAATRYLQEKLGPKLAELFTPPVSDALSSVGATRYYNDLANEARKVPLVGDRVELDLTQYVTQAALDGLFLKLADEERRIREDPVARSTELLKQLWGS